MKSLTMGLNNLLASKKAIMTVLGLVCLTLVFILTDKLGTETFIYIFSGLVGLYGVSQAIADAGNGKKK